MADKSVDSLASPISTASLSSLQLESSTVSKETTSAHVTSAAASPRHRQSGAPRTGAETSATKVFVRVRPFNDRERKLQERGRPVIAIVYVDEQNPSYITTLDPAKAFAPRETYVFERCFNSAAAQAKTLEEANEQHLTAADMEACGRDQCDVYEHVGHPVLENAVKGYNGCVFAYGQTGSGKTFTMMGPPDWAGFIAQTTYSGSAAADSANTAFSLDFSKLPARTAAGRSASQAVTPRTPRGTARHTRSRAGTILSTMSDVTSLSRGGGDELDISSETVAGKPSYGVEGIVPRLAVELFRALNRKRVEDSSHSFRVEMEYYEIYNERVMDLLRVGGNAELRIRNSSNGPYVENLTRKTVLHANDVFKLLQKGNAERHTATTKMNDRSSRSHAILSLHIVQVKLASDDTSSKMSSKINLVDLAGSERTGASGVAGQQFKEATKINLSLTTLGRVIDALADLSQGKHGVFCPYRDSNLTWLLMDSLGGNSKTTMVATVSPHPVNFEETCQTLRYASRAKQIVTRATINEDPQVRQIRLLQAEVQRLQGLLNGEEDGRDDYVEELKERLSMLQGELDAKTVELEHTYEELAALRSVRAAAAQTSAKAAGSPSTASPASGSANTKELARLREEVSRLEAENVLLANGQAALHDAREQARKAEAKVNQMSLVLRSAEKKSADAQATIRRLEKESRDVQRLKDKLKKVSQQYADSTEREAQLREAVHSLEQAHRYSDAATGRPSSMGAGETITARLQRMQSLTGSAAVTITPAVTGRRRSSAATSVSDSVHKIATAEKAATEWKLKFEQEQALHTANKQRLKEKHGVIRELEARLKRATDDGEDARHSAAKQREMEEKLSKTQSMLVEAELALGRTQLEADSAIELQRDLQRRHTEEVTALEDERNALVAARDDLAAQLSALKEKVSSDVVDAETTGRADTEAVQRSAEKQMQAWRALHAYEQRVSMASQSALMHCSHDAQAAKIDYALAAIADVVSAQQRASETAMLDTLRAGNEEAAARYASAAAEHERIMKAQEVAADTERATLKEALTTAHAALVEARATAMRTMEAHQAEVAVLTADCDAAQSQLAAQQDELDKMCQSLAGVHAELQRATLTKEALTEHIAGLEAAKTALEAELETLHSEAAERELQQDNVATLAAQVAQLEAALTAAKADMDALSLRHDAARQDAQSRLEAEQQQALSEREAALAALHASHQKEIEQHRGELQKARAVCEALRLALEEASRSRDQSAAVSAESLAKAREEYEAAAAALREREATLAHVRAALDSARSEAAQLQSAMENQADTVKNLEKVRDETHQRAERAETSHLAAQEEVAALNAQLTAQTAALSAVQSQLEATRTDMAAQATAHDAAQDEAKTRLLARERDAELVAASVTARLEQAQAEREALKRALDERTGTVNDLEAARDEAVRRAENAEAACVAASANQTALQSQFDKLSTDAENLSAQLAASEEDALNAKKHVRTLEKSLRTAEAAGEAAEASLADANEEKKQLIDQLEVLRTERDEARAASHKAEMAQQAAECRQRDVEGASAQERDALREALENLRRDGERAVAEHRAAQDGTQRELQQTATELAALQRSLADKAHAHDALAARTSELEAERTAHKQAREAMEAQHAATVSNLSATQTALEEAENARAAFAQRLQSALQAQEASSEAARQREESLMAELAQLKEELLSTRQEATDTERRLSDALSAAQVRLDALQAERDEARDAHASLSRDREERAASQRRAHEEAVAALEASVAAAQTRATALAADLESERSSAQAAREAAEASAEKLRVELTDMQTNLAHVKAELVQSKEALSGSHSEREAALAKIRALEELLHKTVEDAAKQLEEKMATEEAKYRSLLRQRDDTIAQLSEDLEFRANLDLCDADATSSSVNRFLTNVQGGSNRSTGISGLFSLLGRKTAGPSAATTGTAADGNGGEVSSKLVRRSSGFDPISSSRRKTSPFT